MKSNKRMMYACVLMLGVGCVGLVFGEFQARTPSTILNRCECWAARDESSLEVGKVVLHFSETPMMNSLPSTMNSSNKDHVFFIPLNSVVSKDIHAIMQAARKNNNKWYSISLSLEKKPVVGIKVVVTYDPEKVTMEHAVFDTLGTNKGVFFRFYNKSMLDKLRSSERSLLRVAGLSSTCSMA